MVLKVFSTWGTQKCRSSGPPAPTKRGVLGWDPALCRLTSLPGVFTAKAYQRILEVLPQRKSSLFALMPPTLRWPHGTIPVSFGKQERWARETGWFESDSFSSCPWVAGSLQSDTLELVLCLFPESPLKWQLLTTVIIVICLRMMNSAKLLVEFAVTCFMCPSFFFFFIKNPPFGFRVSV